jgi:hypothetical protein
MIRKRRKKKMLNNNARTEYDKRNEEARKHIGHEYIVERKKCVGQETAYGYDELKIICLTCNKQFKAHNWLDKEEIK